MPVYVRGLPQGVKVFCLGWLGCVAKGFETRHRGPLSTSGRSPLWVQPPPGRRCSASSEASVGGAPARYSSYPYLPLPSTTGLVTLACGTISFCLPTVQVCTVEHVDGGDDFIPHTNVCVFHLQSSFPCLERPTPGTSRAVFHIPPSTPRRIHPTDATANRLCSTPTVYDRQEPGRTEWGYRITLPIPAQ